VLVYELCKLRRNKVIGGASGVNVAQTRGYVVQEVLVKEDYRTGSDI
jgi:hypothetical protein